MTWLWASAIFMVITAVIHSFAGEKRLIGPIIALGSNGIPSKQGRLVMRAAWHLTSAFMVLCAVVVAWPAAPAGLVQMVGGFWLAVGLFSLMSSRGRHVGWPTLTAAGITALLGSAL
jgi:hypothetical protein